MRLDELNIYDVGNTIQISGAIYSGNGKTFLAYLPGEKTDLPKVELEMDQEAWLKFLHQTDVLEVEVWDGSSNPPFAKAIHRKTARQIDSKVQWAVFKRDGYSCRYCGKNDVPLTVDHLVLWEEGGPTIPENLVACCKHCNKLRGNMPYAEWLESEAYKQRSRHLALPLRDGNQALAALINHIPRMEHVRSR